MFCFDPPSVCVCVCVCVCAFGSISDGGGFDQTFALHFIDGALVL